MKNKIKMMKRTKKKPVSTNILINKISLTSSVAAGLQLGQKIEDPYQKYLRIFINKQDFQKFQFHSKTFTTVSAELF